MLHDTSTAQLARRDTDLIARVALIGNFLPRRCGLATYTMHVYRAMRQRFPGIRTDVYAINDRREGYDYPTAVSTTIDQEDIGSYRDAAALIDLRQTELVWVQHEFGIFGGPAGEHLLALLDRVSAPIIVTLHSILPQPNDDQRRVMERLLRRAALVTVMATSAETILRRCFGDLVTQLITVPHGIPDLAYEQPSAARRRLGSEDRPTIMSFGLLSPDKGIESMIAAMPEILAHCPGALYRIVGATHPHLLAHEGEAYRERLRALAEARGVAGSLRWDNRFLEEGELLDQLAAADIYVSPYRNPLQITSGTLAYAAGLGKAIVSTPYPHARELLADGRGTLVDFDDAKGLARATVALLQDDAKRQAMSARIWRHSRNATWVRMTDRIIGHAAALRPIASATTRSRPRTLPAFTGTHPA